jgi:hypothetical protein
VPSASRGHLSRSLFSIREPGLKPSRRAESRG